MMVLPTKPRCCAFAAALLMGAWTPLIRAQEAVRPYVTRGHQVETVQKTLTERVARFHDAFAAILTQVAPDLVPRLEPPPPIATGYQLLPHVLQAGAPETAQAPPQIINFSWIWSETLMANETKVLEGLEARLQRTPVAGESHAVFDSLVTDYRSMIDRKKLVDADINYNWLWQAEIMRIPRFFERATKLQQTIVDLYQIRKVSSAANDSTRRVTPNAVVDSILKVRTAEVERGLDEEVRRVDVPLFVRFRRDGRDWIITVPMVTDITDTAFVGQFRRAVEGYWHMQTPSANYRAQIDLTTIDPQALYCPAGTASPCAPPAKGTAIDLAMHIGRFPPNVAVLTTGAGSTHATAGRAIAVSPHDVSTTLLAHEFGHLLGFHDAYLRGSVPAGADGFYITELVVDRTDIMGNSGNGRVFASHFERLIAVKDVPALVQAGLRERYENRNPTAAIARFSEVLAINEFHFGARLELARALDAAGRSAEATPHWARMLDMAETVGDLSTADEARRRLARGSQ